MRRSRECKKDLDDGLALAASSRYEYGGIDLRILLIGMEDLVGSWLMGCSVFVE